MTTITNPADAMVQAIFLRAHLRLLAAGMKNSRLSGKAILEKATAITGKKYARKGYAEALADLSAFIAAN